MKIDLNTTHILFAIQILFETFFNIVNNFKGIREQRFK